MWEYRKNDGYSLIEVLVALVVTALGVLGLVGAHLNAMKFNATADARSQATFLAYDIADRMRANRRAALAGDYDMTLGDAAPSGSAVHDIDRRSWLNALATRLTDGDGAIARSNNTFTITVQWDESRVASTRQADLDGNHIQTFVFVTEL